MTTTAEPIHLAVLGAGPGGYPAAFLASELGMKVTLIDTEENPGGVCLYRGCIPSKALLHVARIKQEVHEAAEFGLHFGTPEIDLDALRDWKRRVVAKLTGGLGTISRARKVEYVRGRGRFVDAHTLRVANEGELVEVAFDYAIVATGSSPAIPGPLRVDSPRVWDSTDALELREVPARLLVVGGGYIGLEMGSVYAALGSEVTIVEMTNGLLPGADRDLVDVLRKSVAPRFKEILLGTRVTNLEDTGSEVRAALAGADVDETRAYDAVLVAVGRRPNSAELGLENTKVVVGDRGFITTDVQRRTAEPSIFAIGDVAGEPMLAHKATHEARAAVEAIAGEPSAFDAAAIPAVVFTDPELAWTGLTENAARERAIDVEIVKFPWAASGRAVTLDRTDGLTKLILEPGTERVLGAGIVGVNAGEMIAEATLAVELGARADDLRFTIHAHPTLSETVMEAAETFFGQSPHYLARRRR
ncbi:MAG: dihydrolipoyl dehydrogenase [Chloroflexi bacterium]|nr:dihydrolipoyl dehydrogenase [Chloroflexota bacterium]MDA1003609.1 dihydrolipoyl dehydrogenase [Chloroflexota bacterium]